MIGMNDENQYLARPRRVRSKRIEALPAALLAVGHEGSSGSGWGDAMTERLAVWKEQVCGLYLNWALCDKALKTLEQGEDHSNDGIDLYGIRAERDVFRRTKLVSLSGYSASLKHDHARDMTLRLSMCELIGLVEDCLLEARDIFLTHHAERVVDLPENSGLHRLYETRHARPEAWDRAWAAHLRSERNDRRREGMAPLVSEYWAQAQLSLPSGYDSMHIEQLGATFQLFTEMRCQLTSHSSKVGFALARASASVGCTDLAFHAGEDFTVSPRHMEVIEGFFFEYLEVLGLAIAGASAKGFADMGSGPNSLRQRIRQLA